MIAQIVDDFPDKEFLAEVISSNYASHKIFLKNDFKVSDVIKKETNKITIYKSIQMKNIFSADYNGVFIIAELSANHNGSKETAIETIKAAKRAGADAIKLQTYTPETMTLDCSNEDFIINNNSIWDGQTFFELYKKSLYPLGVA